MSDLMKELLQDVKGVHCHTCTYMFSTDRNSSLTPNNTLCGHYVCVSCYQKLVKTTSDGNYSYECGLCKFPCVSVPRYVRSIGFIEFLREIDQWLNAKDDGTSCAEILSFHGFLKQFSGMTCYGCKNIFATDSSSPRAPTKSFCGHYICKECNFALRIPLEMASGKNYKLSCRICGYQSINGRDQVSYGYFGLLAELQKRLLEIWSQRYHTVKCSKCEEEVLFHKAQTCTTCCETDKGATPICSDCVIQYHRRSKHKLVAYGIRKRTSNIQKSSKKLKDVEMTRKQLKSILKETRREIDSMSTEIARVHEFVESSSDMAYYPITKRLCVELHNFETTAKDLQSQLKNYLLQIRPTRTSDPEEVPAERKQPNDQEIHQNIQHIPPKIKEEPAVQNQNSYCEETESGGR